MGSRDEQKAGGPGVGKCGEGGGEQRVKSRMGIVHNIINNPNGMEKNT